MQFSAALDRTLDEFAINAKWLATRAGVSQQMISDFRNGKQRVYNDSLEKIIAALPDQARQHYFTLLGASPVTLKSQIEVMDNVELAILLSAIADKLQRGKTQQLLSA
jgi:transcriptional regulator with XRE-family HTH domain